MNEITNAKLMFAELPVVLGGSESAMSLSRVRENTQSEKMEFPQIDLGSALDPQALRQAKYMDDEQMALAVASKHMESLLVQQMFKAMRSTSSAIGDEDNPLSMNSNGIFQEYLDQQLVLNMSKTSSFGIAELMYQQLSR
ncbi:rod-binding protein [Vibrio mediterranei]|uniref:rod-binding protein n=1 Tax=Vibrio mediterranei TaxID=689 RepID=UPI0040698880